MAATLLSACLKTIAEYIFCKRDRVQEEKKRKKKMALTQFCQNTIFEMAIPDVFQFLPFTVRWN